MPPIQRVSAQSTVATGQQNLIVAQNNLQLQQLLMKNALSRSIEDPILAEADVIPTSTMQLPQQDPVIPNSGLNQPGSATPGRVGANPDRPELARYQREVRPQFHAAHAASLRILWRLRRRWRHQSGRPLPAPPAREISASIRLRRPRRSNALPALDTATRSISW